MPPSQLSVPDDLVFTSNGQDMLALKGSATPPAAIVHAPTGAVADGDLSPNTLSPSIDETNHALHVRVEYSDTTLKTAVIPFQVPSVLTVGPSGADFTTIMAAWNFLKGRALASNVTIAVQSGTYAESVTLADQPYSGLITIQGDTRTAAGQRFATTGSITKSGSNSNCTITLTATPPSDFTSSDYIVIGGTGTTPANAGRFPIVSIDTVNKTVTYVNASGVTQAVRPNTALIFCPDRIIDFSGLGNGVSCGCFEAPLLSGFTVLASTAATNAVTASDGALTATKCVAFGADYGFQVRDGGILKLDATCSAVKCSQGFYAALNGTMNAPGVYAANCSNGFLAAIAGTMIVQNAVAATCTSGFFADGAMIYATPGAVAADGTTGFSAQNAGNVAAGGSTARANGTGYYAQWSGLITAASTSANNTSTATYSPPTSGTVGNFNGLIHWT